MHNYYLAYGSNLYLEQMYKRCPNCKLIGSSILKDYRLAYKGECDGRGFLTIEPCKGMELPVGVFDLTPSDVDALNKYEGYPNVYSKLWFNIPVDGTIYNAFIYIMNEGYNYSLPSSGYERICMQGYETFNFDPTYLNEAVVYTLSQQSKKIKFR